MSFPKPHITPDSFFHETASASAPSRWPITVYFITGNPGLISYYHTFLSLLGKKLAASDPDAEQKCNPAIHIFGHSLAGFELSNKEPEDQNTDADSDEPRYYDLEEQISFVRGKLDAHMRSLRGRYAAASVHGSSRPNVILIGHSVGSYIAMEVLRRHRECPTFQPSDDENGFDIVGGVLLFPTVVDIAKSPSGQKLTFLLRIIPQLALVVAFIARLLTLVLPDAVLRSLIWSVMRSPPKSALEATLSFLKSTRGVRQALHMAADEMETITSDKWSDDIWGVSTSKEPMTRLFFYFGRNDHWVAEQTRDEIIRLRGSASAAATGPKMIVCEDSVPHAFCLRHNETMSSKVAGMIREIIASD